jgi:hypothetical protein
MKMDRKKFTRSKKDPTTVLSSRTRKLFSKRRGATQGVRLLKRGFRRKASNWT